MASSNKAVVIRGYTGKQWLERVVYIPVDPPFPDDDTPTREQLIREKEQEFQADWTPFGLTFDRFETRDLLK